MQEAPPDTPPAFRPLALDDGMLTSSFPTARYLGAGFGMVWREPSLLPGSLARWLLGVASPAWPVLVLGGVLWLLAGGSARIVEEGARNPLPAWEQAMAWIDGRLSVGLVAGLFVGVPVWLLTRAWVDALWYERMRRLVAAEPALAPEGVGPAGRVVGFGALALLRLGLTTGTLLFMTPFFRVTAELLTRDPGSMRTRIFAGISVALALVALAWLHFGFTVVAGWMTWRPRFLAGTVVAALGAPFRQWRVYRGLLALHALGHTTLSGLGLLLVAGWLGSAGHPGAAVGWAVALGMLMGLALTLGVWWNACVVVLVGQRLGDVVLQEPAEAGVAEEESGPRQADAAPRAQQRFEPPLRGAWVAAAGQRHVHDSILAFDELRAPAAPTSAPVRLRWQVVGLDDAHVDALEPAEPSLAGASQMILRALPAAGEPQPWPSVSGGRPDVPGLCWNPGIDGTLDAMVQHVGRARWVTGAGALEQSWRLDMVPRHEAPPEGAAVSGEGA
jgi:hypothetical protein